MPPIRLLLTLCLCLLLLLMGCQAAVLPQGDRVYVSRVVSGQTLEILDPTGRTAGTERVRLIGVDAPAWGQEPWFSDAKKELEELLSSDKNVLLQSDLEKAIAVPNGSKIRLAYVWKDGILLNERLLQAGRVVLSEGRSPNLKYDQRLTRAQEKARLSGLGLWNPDHPMRQSPQDVRSPKQ